MSGRRKPRVVGMGQDITVVERPPPGPPDYELVRAWPPIKPPRKALKSRTPLIISSTALAVVMVMLIMVSNPALQPLISPPAPTTTVQSTITTTASTTITTTVYTTPAIVQGNYTAVLKIVTDSWDGTGTPPVTPAGIDFPGRYNVTNVCVELYRFKNPGRASVAPLTEYDRVDRIFSPDAMGFVEVSWPAEWENLTIIVKGKSYQGECIIDGTPFSGIIVYWLTVNPTASFRTKFGVAATGNVTIGDDGIEQNATTGAYFNWGVDAPFNSGPIDIVSPKNTTTWGADFEKDHNVSGRAWVAHAAYIFKLFHEHTWYGTNDTLTYATIFIYDTDHTPADSPHSLIQAAITGPDGQSRYTREIYPVNQSLGEFDPRFANNTLVPIPLQSINLGLKKPFMGGITDPKDRDGNIGAPHLNATKRVWWETVLTNQTFYVGKKYNGTGNYFTEQGTNITRPLFGAFPTNPAVNPTITQGNITDIPAGPFSLALNHTVTNTTGLGWIKATVHNVASFGNNTVFYSLLCIKRDDTNIADTNITGAEIMLKFITSTNITDYPAYKKYNTTETGCTNKVYFPNGTDWGRRGSLNTSYFFIPINDISPAWSRYFMQERGSDGDLGPYNNANKNWSALIPKITYMMTRILTDDPRWGGFEIQIKYNEQPIYRGRIYNPYTIAVEPGSGWITRKVPNLPDLTVEKDRVIINVRTS